jgi:cysteinyl-tRNA synthetase
MLKLYNTLTGRKDILKTLTPRHVGMYACGVTVYDDSHLGHARSAFAFEMLRNYLQFSGYSVRYVRNFTDVDDKIINRASREGVSWQDIVERYLQAYRRDMGRLGIAPPDVEPRATEHMAEIIAMIRTLLEKQHAYQIGGDVYYEVETYPEYGRLSKRKREDILAGARVEVDERKRNPMDFALWKASKPGEPSWGSPWGEGRPGWHIECSAMSIRHLGETFDIHGGGMDLIFPHHENELAQSCAATGKEFAHYWVHNGFVEINKEKMSKSLGNFFTIREVFEQSDCKEEITAEVLRYFFLATHYRSPLDFSDSSLREAKRALDSFYGLFLRLEEVEAQTGHADGEVEQSITRFEQGFREAMDDDCNTPAALAQFQLLRGEINSDLVTGLSRRTAVDVYDTFQRIGRVLGLFQMPVKEWVFKDIEFQLTKPDHGPAQENMSTPDIEQLLAARNEARRAKNFSRADEIRSLLAARGITIEDRPDGTSRWKR